MTGITTITRGLSIGVGAAFGAVGGATKSNVGAVPGLLGGGVTGLALHDMVLAGLRRGSEGPAAASAAANLLR